MLCTLLKPIVRHLASRLSVELRLAQPRTVGEAQAAVDAMMVRASAALAPFMAAAAAELQAFEARLRVIETTGQMTVEEANRLQRTGQARIHAPFQDRIDALRGVQASAMRLFAEKTNQAVRAHAPSPASSHPSLVCSPDGAVCSLVPVRQNETGR